MAALFYIGATLVILTAAGAVSDLILLYWW